ncbi:MAG: transcription termination/antitermination protein NusG [Clostridia bacterium]|nr:transcription termination/antitermination protein NusG [Clostridia bacterium]
MINENKEARWYVVHTYTGYENKVKTNLEKIIDNRGLSDVIMDVKIPVEVVIETTASGEQKQVEHKIYPSYVIVKMIMTDATWHIVRNTTGVTGFVGPGSAPVALTEKEVESLGLGTPYEAASKFAVGNNVKITGGPMAGFSGTVAAISPDNKKITVNASVFGRETPVELDANCIELEKI